MVEIKKRNSETVSDYFQRLSNENYKLKSSYQGVTVLDIERVLTRLDNYANFSDLRDVIWCLLNNELPSLFGKSEGFTIADGASTAHIGGYVGILMRNKGRMDREGRDYWIKPLTEIGIIEKCTYFSKDKTFIPGHTKAKSPNSAYKLDSSFINLLSNSGNANFEKLFEDWCSRSDYRLEIQAEAIKEAQIKFKDNKHLQLINDSISIYAKHFLPDYKYIYKDAFDGTRIPENVQTILDKYNIRFELDDVYPDVILVNEKKESLWFIEAVTSDGEVDEQKMRGLKRLCEKSNNHFDGATTAYETWNKLAIRQTKQRNLAKDSYVWIREDPGRHFKIEIPQR